MIICHSHSLRTGLFTPDLIVIVLCVEKKLSCNLYMCTFIRCIIIMLLFHSIISIQTQNFVD